MNVSVYDSAETQTGGIKNYIYHRIRQTFLIPAEKRPDICIGRLKIIVTFVLVPITRL